MAVSLQFGNRGGEGRSFYRLMALIGFLSTILFGVVFIQFLDHTYEPIWDRVAVGVISLGIYLYTGRKGVSNKEVYRVCNILFYLFTIHILWTCYNNHFHWTYVLSLVLTLQSVTISFRDDKQAGPYALTIGLLLVGSVLMADMPSVQSRVVVLMALLISSFLLYLVVRIRSRFYYKIRAQEDVLRSIVTSSENGILILNMEGFVTDANMQACELLGCSFKELKGRSFNEFREKALTPREEADLLERLHTEPVVSSEFNVVRDDGGLFSSYTTTSLIQQSGNRFMVCRVKDFTERKAFQQSLITAKEEAERAAELKSQFMATVSHEIRTPLNGIMGMTELVLQTDINAEQQGFLEQIQSSNNHLLFIVNDILDFSKAERGKMELDVQSIDLYKLCQESASTFMSSAASKGLSFQFDLDPSLPKCVRADEHRLKQILLNLIGNAIKFTESGSIGFSVTEDPESGDILFTVSDSGIGIPEDKLVTLFQAFSQVDASHSRKFGGTGLGLAISHKLAQAMQGTLKVESTLGEGSVFKLSLPLERDELPVAMTVERNKEQPPLQVPSNLRVMLAEDNAINQHVGKLILGQMGIEADIAVNGKEVLEKLRTQNYDIIFMDLQMPEMDGLEATQRILDPNGEFDRKPVIVAMTANAMPQDIAMCESVGMQGFVSKPIMLDDLRRALEKSLGILGRRA